MEPAVGIEPTTDGLQNRCSTAELSWYYQFTPSLSLVVYVVFALLSDV
jgi:hypothetical protein